MLTPEQIAENFISQSGSIAAVEEYGSGKIHDTFLVTPGDSIESFILQRINTRVFKRPELIMHNLRLLCDHVHNQKTNRAPGIDPDWRMLHIIPNRDGWDFFIDPEGGFWRALDFIHGAHPLERIASLENAREVGRALGLFHALTSSFNPEQLQDTLPGFHNIELYLSKYDQALSQGLSRGSSKMVKLCREFVEDRRYWAPVLENARRHNKLQNRIIHGDPKINNVMLDNKTNKAVSIIDLDTVKPGLVHYDLGDCLRSCCNIEGEETGDLDAVRFDLARCTAVLTGYMKEAKECISARDFEFIYDAVRLIPYELGVRLFTDFLEGDIYFKTNYPFENMDRAMVQFKLVESIEKQETEIRTLIDTCQKSYRKL